MRLFSRPEPVEPEPLAPGPHLLHDGSILARWFVEYRLTQEVDRAKRYHRPLSVLVAVPSLLGDERLTAAALEAAAAATMVAARETDLVGWIGDDRILVIMPETTADQATVALSRWRDEMWLRSRGFGGQKWQIVMLDELVQFDDVASIERSLNARNEQEQNAA